MTFEPSSGVSSTGDNICDDCRAGVPPAHQSPRRSAPRRTPVPRSSRLRRDVVPGFSKQHLCNRDLTKIRIPRILGHDPQYSRLPNPYLAEVRGKQRASQPLHDTQKDSPPRGAGHGFVPEEPRGDASRSAQGSCRAPPGGPLRSAVPATRQAAGVPSAWSQPSQSTYARPRRWCDAGPPGRQKVTAAQKAGAEDMIRNNGSNLDRGRIRFHGR